MPADVITFSPSKFVVGDTLYVKHKDKVFPCQVCAATSLLDGSLVKRTTRIYKHIGYKYSVINLAQDVNNFDNDHWMELHNVKEDLLSKDPQLLVDDILEGYQARMDRAAYDYRHNKNNQEKLIIKY